MLRHCQLFVVMVFMCFCIGFVSSCSSVSEVASPEEFALLIPEAKSKEIEALQLINAYRLERGLHALQLSDTIKAVAYSHNLYMIEQQRTSHDYFFSRKRYLETYLQATAVVENVAYGYGTSGGVLAGWLNSDSHKRAIEGDFTHFDLSAEQDDAGRWYYTNIFVKK